MTENGRAGPYLGPEELNTTNGLDRRGHGLPSLSKTCFIQPKSTGLASLFLQFGLLIVSGITAMFFFYHVGGYEYMQWNENSTILEPVHHNYPSSIRVDNAYLDNVIIEIPREPVKEETTVLLISTSTLTAIIESEPLDDNDTLVSNANRSLDFINQSIALNEVRDTSQPSKRDVQEQIVTTTEPEDALSDFIDSLLGNDKSSDNATFGIEQVPMTTIIIAGVEFDWLEVIRISTLVYLIICFLWFITMVFFIFTIRCEILDTAMANTVFLALVVLYQFVHSFLIVALVFFQTEMSWRTMAITVGSIIILSCCAFLGCVCFSLNIGWVKYIDYMHSKRKCLCLAGVVRLIKGKEHRSSNRRGEEYTMSERHTVNNENHRYDNDVPIHQFSAF